MQSARDTQIEVITNNDDVPKQVKRGELQKISKEVLERR